MSWVALLAARAWGVPVEVLAQRFGDERPQQALVVQTLQADAPPQVPRHARIQVDERLGRLRLCGTMRVAVFHHGVTLSEDQRRLSEVPAAREDLTPARRDGGTGRRRGLKILRPQG